MKIAIFGLSVSSAWGNGHATLWRGLCSALARRRHNVVFFEHDTDYYSQHRDLTVLPGGELIIYSTWQDVQDSAKRHLRDADVAIVTSYCPDALAASAIMLGFSRLVRVFYDLDTPVTLAMLRTGRSVDYIGPRGLRDFDLVLSYTGGAALTELQKVLGARAVAPLYGSVDPSIHFPVPVKDRYRGDLSYLGTYSNDRHAMLRLLFLEPARLLPERRFVLGGSQYDPDFPWKPNIFYFGHVPPADHSAFYCSSRLTLNVTRGPMAGMGYCPSGRLFEAAACGTPILSDNWQGLEDFFRPGSEILVADRTEDALDAFSLSSAELAKIGAAARERALAEHTASARARELETILESAFSPTNLIQAQAG